MKKEIACDICSTNLSRDSVAAGLSLSHPSPKPGYMHRRESITLATENVRTQVTTCAPMCVCAVASVTGRHGPTAKDVSHVPVSVVPPKYIFCLSCPYSSPLNRYICLQGRKCLIP